MAPNHKTHQRLTHKLPVQFVGYKENSNTTKEIGILRAAGLASQHRHINRGTKCTGMLSRAWNQKGEKNRVYFILESVLCDCQTQSSQPKYIPAHEQNYENLFCIKAKVIAPKSSKNIIMQNTWEWILKLWNIHSMEYLSYQKKSSRSVWNNIDKYQIMLTEKSKVQ